MKQVLWISDERRWAYDTNARALAKNMPQYNHNFFYTAEVGPEAIENVKDSIDIFVAMNPAGFYMYKEFHKVISILDTVRAITGEHRVIFSNVAGIICNNGYLAKLADSKNENTLLQPNGVDLDHFVPAERQDRRLTLGFAGNIQGSYAFYKGWNVYQEAASLVDVDQVNVLYGTESRLPPEKMVSDFYHKIDVLVLASQNEGCSNVITEALACGVPVICTKVGYHGETLLDGVECIFVEQTASSILNAIIKMQSYNLASMGESARWFAEKHHDIKKVAANYAKFFERVL